MPGKGIDINIRQLFLNLSIPHDNPGIRVIASIIWNGALPRLARPTLWLPIQFGGLALPNFKVFFCVAMLVSVH